MTLSLPTGSARLTAIAIVVWVVQPFTSGVLIGEALTDTDDPFRTTVSVAAWALWLAILIAMAVPRPITLTIARIGAAGGVAATAWASWDASNDSSEGSSVLIAVALVSAIAALASISLPGVADRFLDGVSYGDERRFCLKAPGPVLLLLIVPSTAVVIVGLTAGPLLLADERWVAGATATVLGIAAAWIPFNALHRLTSRFLVFVPNGLVVHDLSQLREPVLFVKREIVALGPARTDSAADDITATALGMALELRLDQPVNLPFVTGARSTESRESRALLVSPTRPAAVLETALERGIKVA